MYSLFKIDPARSAIYRVSYGLDGVIIGKTDEKTNNLAGRLNISLYNS